MISAEDFANAVDSLTGQLAFTLPLMTLPGPAALQVPVGLSYGSQVHQQAYGWNLSDPTGVAGLGWTLPRSAVLAIAPYGADPGDAELVLVLEGHAVPLIPTAANTANGQQWLATSEPGWQVSYNSVAQIWTLIDENGSAYTFGGLTAAGSIEYGVAVGDWLASVTAAAPQSQIATAWNLVSITDLFGNRATFFYDLVTSTLGSGGLAYTQASYLSRIVGAWGDTIAFSYVNKQSYEYAYPYTNPAPPNAYQARVETRALQSIAMTPAGASQPQVTASLAYNTAFNVVVSSNTAFNKRVLTSVTLSYPNGYAFPPLNFSYAVSGANPGALASVTTVEGSVVTYNYAAADGGQTLQYSSRTARLAPPITSGVAYTVLRLLFEDAFTIVLWSGSDASVVIAPYRWQGRWLAGTQTIISGATAGGATVLSASSPEVFAIVAGGAVYSFAPDPRVPDGWIAANASLSGLQPAGTSGYQLAAGNGFAAIACMPSGGLLRTDFTSLSWSAPQAVSTALSGQNGYGLAAQGNKLMLVGATTSRATLWLSARATNGSWSSGSVSLNVSLGTAPSVTACFCAAGAAISVAGMFGTDQRHSSFGSTFAASGLPQSLTLLAQGAGAASLQAAGMTIGSGSMVSRYDGQGWITSDLSSLGVPAGAALGAIAIGPDIAARVLTLSGGAQRYDLIAYNANTGTWSVAASAGPPASGAGVAAAPRMLRGSGRYALLGNTLYYMNSDLSWSAVSAAALPTLSADDSQTVQVLDDDYVVFQTAAANSATAWFLGNGSKTASDTASAATLLVPGQAGDYLIGDASFVTYQGTWNGAGVALTLHRPVNQAIQGAQSATVVSTVAVTSGYAAQATTVTIPGASTQASVQLQGDLQTNYAFASTAATISADGVMPLFNCSTIVPAAPSGLNASIGRMVRYQFNGLAASESTPRPPPTAAGIENTAENASIVVGLIYAVIPQDSSGAEAALTENYWFATVVPQSRGCVAYARMQRNVTTLDGVPSQIDMAFDANTGLLATTTTSYVDSIGATVATTDANTYFWQEYDSSRSLNILSPVVQLTRSAIVTPAGEPAGTAQTIASEVCTWRQEWSGGVTGWAPSAIFRQTDAQAAVFNAWTDGTPAPSGWQQIGAVTARASTGLITASVDAGNVATSLLADAAGRFIYAGANGCDETGLSYYGCESYEQPGSWQVVAGGSLSAYLTASDAHTGTTSLSLPANTGSGQFVCYFEPSDLTQSYVFSCWARSPNGYGSSGAATAKITATWTSSGNPGSATLATLTLSSTTNSTWLYAQTQLDIPQALGSVTPDPGSFVCKVLLANANTANAILLDELRLSPLSAAFNALTVDTARWLQTAAIDTNGQSLQPVYDGWRRAAALIGPDNSVLGASCTGLSRGLPGTQGAFNSWWPNSSAALTPGGATQYDDFHTDTSANWTFGNKGGDPQGSWSVGGGRLSYTGSAVSGALGGTASPSSANTANFAARILVAPGAGTSPAIGDGTVFLRWDDSNGNGAYSLVSAATDGALTTLQSLSTSIAFGSDWLFIAVDGFYLCAVNGVFVFSYQRASGAPAGAGLMLASDGSCDFDELIRLDDPQVALSCFDAMARPTLLMGLIGGTGGSTNVMNVLAASRYYDSFGRPCVTGAPLSGPLVLSSPSGALPPPADAALLPDGSPTQYLGSAQSGTAVLTAYVQDGLAVPEMPTQLLYNWSASEATPLGRPLSSLPVRPFSARNGLGYQRSFAYRGLATLPSATPPSGDPPLVYRQAQLTAQTAVKGTNASSVVIGAIRAQDGRVLEVSLGSSNVPAQILQGVTYTPGGQIATRTQANAASPPEDTTAANWTESFAYDFLGRTITWTSSDRGVTQYAYDGRDQLRFFQDSAGAAVAPQRINYNRYDALGRLIEQGWIADSNYTWGSQALLAQLENQGFPHVAGGTGSGTQVAGRWRTQLNYDSDSAGNARNLLGRVWQTSSQPDAGTDGTTTQFGYDDLGQVVSAAERITASQTVSDTATGYGYDSAGRLNAIVYPALDANNPSVGYYYDRIGRLAGIGTVVADGQVVDPFNPIPQPEVRYARYQYGSAGELSAIDLNQPPTETAPAFTRALGYDAPQRVIGIDDPYVALSFGYAAADGTATTTERIASATIAYQVSQNWVAAPAPFGFAYSYDTPGRLTKAIATTESAAAFGFDASASNSYDANGNRVIWNRGVTAYTASYPTNAGGAGDPGKPANGMVSLAPSVSGQTTFNGASGSSAGLWSWGSSNGGPSTSSIAGTTGAQYLALGGGNALGHYEVLLLDTWLEPSANLTLTAITATDDTYPTSGNRAAWSLALYGLSGLVTEKVLQYVPAGTGAGNWTTQSIAVNVAAAISASGYAGEITRARLALQNMTQGPSDDAAGARVYVQSLTPAWASAPSWSFDYDKNGSVVSDTQIALNPVNYDYLSYRSVSATAGGNMQTWLYDSGGRTAASTVTSGGSATTILQHFDLGGRLIAAKTGGANSQTIYYINGPTGPIAIQQGDTVSFALTDQLGSIRALIDGDGGAAQASFDYQPFGGMARMSGAMPGMARFAGHAPDPATRLMPTPARLLDTSSGRFLQVDPRFDGLSPYAYALNNPVNLTDPTGEFYQAVLFAAAMEGGYNLYSNYNSNNTFSQNALYFGAGSLTGVGGWGISLGYSSLFSVAAGTHFVLAGVAQSATSGAYHAVAQEWLNRKISGNWTGYDESWSGLGWRFASGAFQNAALSAGAGVAGTIIGSFAFAPGPRSTRGWYNPLNLYRGLYNPSGNYAYYRNRANDVLREMGFSRWHEFEHTVPQRWTAGSLTLRTFSNAPVQLFPVTQWFNTPFLEGKAKYLWWPARKVLGQRHLANLIRSFYAPAVIGSLVGANAAAGYAAYRRIANRLNGATGSVLPDLPEPKSAEREL